MFFVENKKLTADLEAVHLSTEADKKEVNILNLSLKQKDAEIDRLKELTRLVGFSTVPFTLDPEKFENAVLFIRLDLPSSPICHDRGAFRRRSSNRRNLKTPAHLRKTLI